MTVMAAVTERDNSNLPPPHLLAALRAGPNQLRKVSPKFVRRCRVIGQLKRGHVFLRLPGGHPVVRRPSGRFASEPSGSRVVAQYRDGRVIRIRANGDVERQLPNGNILPILTHVLPDGRVIRAVRPSDYGMRLIAEWYALEERALPRVRVSDYARTE